MSDDRSEVLREIAYELATEMYALDADDGEIREVAHTLGRRFPVHVTEYAEVRRLMRDMHNAARAKGSPLLPEELDTEEVCYKYVLGELGDDAIDEDLHAPYIADFHRWLNKVKEAVWDEVNFDICDGVKNHLNPYRD